VDYRQYLQSASWKTLAQAARYRAGNACEFCGGNPDNVHHVKYPANKNYAADCLENLIVCCASCHAKQHGIRGKAMYKFDRMVLTDGSRIIWADIEGKPWLKFDDLCKQFGIEASVWGFYTKVIHENKDWVYVQNELSKKLEVFLSRSGVNKLGARYGCNDKADEILQKLVDLDENKGLVVTDFGEYNDDPIIQAMVVASKNCLAIAKSRQDICKMQEIQQEHGIKFIELQQNIDKANKAIEVLIPTVDREFMTAREYLIIHGKEFGIAPEKHYPGHKQPNSFFLGRKCGSFITQYKKLELPPKVQEGTYPVQPWPLDILKQAFDVFLREYPQDLNSKLF
jgi:hypothetical protein